MNPITVNLIRILTVKQREDITITTWGVDNKYWASENARRESGRFYPYVKVFDVWCPAGQLLVRITDQMIIKGMYDDLNIAPAKP